MVDRVSREPSGWAEQVLLQNAENLFAGWRKVSMEVNPIRAWGVFSHVEAGGFNRPGDAAIAWGLGGSPIPAGSDVASEIYARNLTQKGRAGAAWDDPEVQQAPTFQQTGATEPWTDILGRTQEQVLESTDFASAEMARQSGVEFAAPDEPTTLFGAVKGLSRWGILVFDAIPEGIDAFLRAADYVGAGEMSWGEALGGMVGANRETAQQVGIPLTQYIRSAIEGERLNMGTGWFAEGQVAEDIQGQLTQFDEETASLTREDFLMRTQQGSPETGPNGGLLVTGLGGRTYEAKNFDEWLFLRENVGRAALLETLQGTSAQQEVLGTPHGAFQEQIFDEASVLRQWGHGAYFANSAGRVSASLVAPPETVGFNVLSASVDLGKQLVDLNLLGLAGRASTLVNRANKFITGGEGAGDLARGTEIMNRLVDGSDGVNKSVMVEGMVNGSLRHMQSPAVRVLTRESLDTDYRLARATVGAIRDQATRTGKGVGQPMEPGEVQAMLGSALAGKSGGQIWARRILSDTQDPNMDIDAAMDALNRVHARQNSDILDDRWGYEMDTTIDQATVDGVLKQAQDDAQFLSDLIDSGKAFVIRDPDNPRKGMLTVDADLGRAGRDLTELAGRRAADRGSKVGMAKALVTVYDEFIAAEDEAASAVADMSLRRAERIAAARGRVEDLKTIPTADGYPAMWHGRPTEDIPDVWDPLEARRGGSRYNILGPGVYSTNDVDNTVMGAAGYGGQLGGDVVHLSWQGDTTPRILDLNSPAIYRQPAAAFGRGLAGAIDEYKLYVLEDLRNAGLLPKQTKAFVGLDLKRTITDEQFAKYLNSAENHIRRNVEKIRKSDESQQAQAAMEEAGLLSGPMFEADVLTPFIGGGRVEDVPLGEFFIEYLGKLEDLRVLQAHMDEVGRGGKTDTLKAFLNDAHLAGWMPHGGPGGAWAPDSLGGAYEMLREMAPFTELDAAQDAMLHAMNIGIRDAGFDGMTHVGGRIMGGARGMPAGAPGEHTVIVWLRPENLKNTKIGRRHHRTITGGGTTKAEQVRRQKALDRNDQALIDMINGIDAARKSGLVDDFMVPADAKNARNAYSAISDIDGLRRLAATTDEQLDKSVSWLGQELLKGTWAARRYAEKLFGDTDDAVARVENLITVLRRSDGDNLLNRGASAVKPRIPEEKLSEFISGKGGQALLGSLAAAKTYREVMAILGPTVEHAGRVPKAVVQAFVKAETPGQAAEVFTKLGSGQYLMPQRIALMGKAAVAGNLGTMGGATAGALVGAEQELDAGGGILDVAGGAVSGAVLGALAGSSVGSLGGYAFGQTNRRIEDVADALDMLLAGTRSTTTEFLKARGVDMGRAQVGLSVPQQLSYAYGHSALGRRMSRSAGTVMNLNDPDDVFYKLNDYARNLGMTTDERVTILQKRTRFERKTKKGEVKTFTRNTYEKVVKSEFADEAAEVAEIQRLLDEGYTVNRVEKMDDAMDRIANMQANNPAAAWVAFKLFFDIAEAKLLAAGLPDEYATALTRFAKRNQEEFLGTTGAMGQASNHAQLAIGGNVTSLKRGALTDAEIWSGHVNLPPPEKVTRAVNQIDKIGRATQMLTGADVMRQAMRNIRSVSGGGDWIPITPKLERNVAVRTARALTATLWAPVILLGRPLAFLSRVLGEDQARMTATGLDSMFHHPFNYMSAILGNWKFFQRYAGRYRGVASRSLIPDEIIDPTTGKINQDKLDNMSEWDLSEEARHALTIYDPRRADENRMYGATTWGIIDQSDPKYLEALATEFRQLVIDPMTRHMARSTAEDPVGDTLNYLLNTSRGNRILNNWARQFDTPEEAATFMGREHLQAFLRDQYARLHLKTGGDWVFKTEKVVIGSDGVPLTRAQIEEAGYDALDDGYTIIRQGDEDLLNIVGSGRLKNVKLINDEGMEYTVDSLRVRDHLTEAKWQAIKDELRARNNKWKRQVSGDPAYDGPRFPPSVKGTKFDPDKRELRGVVGMWDDAVDRIYDWVLGRPTRWFSRQPVMGNYYWERIGMLMPTMSPQMRNLYLQIAKKEGAQREVLRISRAFEDAGVGRTGVLDNTNLIDTNAKAYAVERTRDILFDLHRQRNFVDGFRIMMPFMGPFVEAMEAWTRVFTNNPIYVWRRGAQVVDHLWNTSDIGDNTTADPFNKGWFYTDPETGEEKFNYPIIGDVLPRMFDASIPEGGAVPPVGGRAAGLNVMFGGENMEAGETPEFAGIPLTALNPGAGAIFQAAAATLVRDPEARQSEIFKWWFPYGTPDNPSQLLPYNLRKFAEGFLPGSENDLVRNTMEQWSRMVAGGEIGQGAKYDFDINVAGAVDEAMEEARQRAIYHNRFEGFMRTLLPTTATPEVLVDLPNEVKGFSAETAITTEAFGDYARELMSPEGAQWWTTKDGYRISTEGDYEVTTEYMNEMFGTDMFSAEFLSLPLTDRNYPRSYTDSGLLWLTRHQDVVQDLPATGPFLMANYANINDEEAGGEEFSFEALDAAVARGDATYFNHDQQTAQIKSRLLKMRNRQIDVEATIIYGPADQLKGEEFTETRNQREAFVSNEKQKAASMFPGGDIPVGQQAVVFDELLLWDRIDWSKYNLNPDEIATVKAMQWYLGARNIALGILQPMGVTKLSNVGSTDEEKAMAQAVRNDLLRIVDYQFQVAAKVGTNMGNFPYLYETYLLPELSGEETEFDPLAALAEVRGQEDGLTPSDINSWGTVPVMQEGAGFASESGGLTNFQSWKKEQSVTMTSTPFGEETEQPYGS